VPLVQATAAEIDALCPTPSRTRRMLQQVGVLREEAGSRCFREQHYYSFDPRVLELQAPVYVNGFWQSARYFEHLREQLVSELQLRPEVEAEPLPLLARIAELEAVAVHVRRGDYLTHPDFRLLDADYYAQAAEVLRARVNAPCFVVFSDDPEWARANLRLPELVIWSFDHGRHSALQDFRMMKACKHFITANSSFSFWSAWLGQHPGKTVACPACWFRNPEWSAAELRAPDWIAL
jgi:hypothetical protein